MGPWGIRGRRDVERCTATARVITIYEGTSEVQRMIIARGAAGSAGTKQKGCGELGFVLLRSSSLRYSHAYSASLRHILSFSRSKVNRVRKRSETSGDSG